MNPFQTLIESSAEGVIVIQDGRIVYHNQAALDISGYPPHLYLNASIDQIIHPEDAPRIMDYHIKRIAGEPISPFIEGKFVRYSGEIRWMQVNSSPVEWQGSSAVVSFISDITDRKLAEAKFTAAFQSAGSIITISDMNSETFESVNDAFSLLTGFMPSEVIGKSAVDLGLLTKETVESIKVRLADKGLVKDLEIELKCKNGQVKHCLYSGKEITFGEVRSLVSVAVDISERKKQQQAIERLALTDSLTGLANRRCFNQRFDEYIKIARRESKTLALLLIDLDKFKPVNDHYGHQVGDEVLLQVAERLQQQRREVDIIARLGGDEFAIVLAFPENLQCLATIAQDVITRLNTPMNVGELEVQIGASIGIACFPNDDICQDALLKKADDALYESKRRGRNVTSFFADISGLDNCLR